jgi:hypothetical protein
MLKSLGRIIGRLNKKLASDGEKIILMGPGRWGSNNVSLGINVTFADIADVSVLVELGWARSCYEPEASYGTHFFLDLVEAEMIYIPLYPDAPQSYFDINFFRMHSSSLARYLDGYPEFDSIIRVIDTPAAFCGKYAAVTVDGRLDLAVCYLQKP